MNAENPLADWPLEDQVDPSTVSEQWWRSRRLAIYPVTPEPVLAADLRLPGPVLPQRGALGRRMRRAERRWTRGAHRVSEELRAARMASEGGSNG